MGKSQQNERIIYKINIKRREVNRIEKREEKSNRDKDYGRLRSVNENDREVQKEKN